jgi:lipoprotein signal peptidase
MHRIEISQPPARDNIYYICATFNLHDQFIYMAPIHVLLFLYLQEAQEKGDR